MLMNSRGIKATELVKLINNIVDEYGDVEVFVTKGGGNPRPIYLAEYYKNENHIELM